MGPLKVSRFMIAMLSLLGIFQTALIVGVLSETLVIPPDEKRILASVEKQRKFWTTIFVLGANNDLILILES